MREIRRHRRAAGRDENLQQLLRELSEMHEALENAYRCFNQAGDPELVEASIYEINAAQSRCSYLLRAIKEAGGEAALRAGSGKGDKIWA